MTLAEENPLLKKTQLFTQLLIISVSLNVALVGTLVYRSFGGKKESEEVLSHRGENLLTNGEIIYSYFHLPFEKLIVKLKDDRLVEEGYRVCDLSLACLVCYHHFDVQRALPGLSLQRRHLLFVHKEGGERIDVPVYPGLKNDHFAAIAQFAEKEEWPLTTKGLFLELSSVEENSQSLIDAFVRSSLYHTAFTLFNRDGWEMSQEEVLSLLLEGEFELVEEIAKEKVFSQEKRQEVLLNLMAKGSPLAAKLLLEKERVFALKRLDDDQLITLLKRSGDVTLAQEVFAGARCDRVRETAAKFLAGDNRRVAVKAEEPQGTPSIYIVKRGDTLWHIARDYKLSLKKLMEENNLTDKSVLRPGMQLKL